MRCTKCSFISFDDLSACAKCSIDLSHLSKELNGTCVETRQEFFLGSAIQATVMSEGDFSDSQALPPIDHSEVNFDDTNTSRFPSMAASSADVSSLGFDDSLSLAAEDDVSIELGDIMPLDLDQLDSLSLSSDSDLEPTDALQIDSLSSDVNEEKTFVGLIDSEIDLDLTDGFDDSGAHFKFNDDLDIDSSPFAPGDDSGNETASLFENTFADLPAEQYEGTDIDFDRELLQQFSDNADLDETISLNIDAGLDQPGFSHILTGDEDSPASLELDESLVAELAGTSALDASGEFSVDFSADHAASGEFVLDEALVAELASDENVAIENFGHRLDLADTSTADYSISSGEAEDLTGDFALMHEADDVELSGLSLADNSAADYSISSVGAEGLTGDFALMHEDDDVELSGLDLADNSAADYSISSGGAEGLTGDFALIHEDDDVELSGLDLADIDVSDLVETPGAVSVAGVPRERALNDTLQEVDGTTALSLSEGEAVSGDDILLEDISGERDGDLDDLSLGVDAMGFDDELESFLLKENVAHKNPVLELFDDDDEDTPPELPA